MRTSTKILTALLATLPLHVWAGGDCEGETTVTLEGYRAKDKTILVSSLVKLNRLEIDASLVEVSLESPTRTRVLWNRPEKLEGAPVREAWLREVESALTQGFQKPNAPRFTARAVMRKTREGVIHEKTFEDPRGFGAFIVRRVIGATTRFELTHRAKPVQEVVLNRDLFPKPPVNPAGLQVTDTLFFLDEFVGGLTHYCGAPFVWTFRLEHPYVPPPG